MVKKSTKSHKGGRALRVEPSFHEVFEVIPDIGKKFTEAGWLGFIQKLKGSHPQIAMAFAHSFNGYEAQVGGLTLFVSESSIAEAFSLELSGEIWFKKVELNEEHSISSLNPGSKTLTGEQVFM